MKDDKNMNSTDPDPAVDNLLIEDPRTEPEEDLLKTNVEKSKSSEPLADCTTVETKLEPLDVSETVDPGQESSEMILDNGLSSGDPQPSDAADTLTLTTLPPEPQTVDNKTKVYLKPPMSPELMIAIAVRNLDPNKEVKYYHNICICKLKSDEH